jgi:hypothetical protein
MSFLTGWLFELEQPLQPDIVPIEEKLMLINDAVQEHLTPNHFFPKASLDPRRPENDTWILIPNFFNTDEINPVNLYLTYSTMFNEMLNVFFSKKTGGSHKTLLTFNIGTMMVEHPEFITYEGFRGLINQIMADIIKKVEEHVELNKLGPALQNEIYDYLSSRPKFRVISSPGQPIEFNILGNPRIYYGAIVEVKIKTMTEESKIRVRFYFNEADGSDLLGVMTFIKGDSFERVFEENWPEIEREIELRFNED